MNPTGSLLLDTSLIIDHFRGDLQVSALLGATNAVWVPTIVVGELYYGAFRSVQFPRHEQQIREFLSLASILNVDGSTAIQYAQIRCAVAQAGTPIPETISGLQHWLFSINYPSLPVINTLNGFPVCKWRTCRHPTPCQQFVAD